MNGEALGVYLKNILNRIISVVVTPFLYVFLFIAYLIEVFLSLIDYAFHTRIVAPKVSVEEVEQLIQTELPIGSSLDKALAFLDEHKYDCDHAVLTNPAYWKQRFSPQSYKIADVQPAIRKMVIAWIHKNGGGLLVRWETEICLYFDEKNQLLTYLVEVTSIGL